MAQKDSVQPWIIGRHERVHFSRCLGFRVRLASPRWPQLTGMSLLAQVRGAHVDSRSAGFDHQQRKLGLGELCTASPSRANFCRDTSISAASNQTYPEEDVESKHIMGAHSFLHEALLLLLQLWLLICSFFLITNFHQLIQAPLCYLVPVSHVHRIHGWLCSAVPSNARTVLLCFCFSLLQRLSAALQS